MKQIVCILLSLLVVMSSLVVGAQNDYDNFVIEETADAVIIKGCVDEKVTEIYVPGEINGKKVVLSEKAFYDYDNLEKITFGEGIEKIPNELCYDCKNLKSVKLSGSITELGESAFASCGSLTTVEHEGAIKKIDDWCFANTALKEFDFSGVEFLGNKSFSGTKLSSVYLPDLKDWDGISDNDINISTMKHNFEVVAYHPLKASHFELLEIGTPFSGCKELKEVKIRYPENGSNSYKSLFANCENIEKVTFENFPGEPSAWEFYNTQIKTEDYPAPENSGNPSKQFAISQKKSLLMVKPEFKFTIYGNGEKAKAYAEKIGVPFVELAKKDEKEITINVNGADIEFDAVPYIKNGRTMVPLRAIFESLGVRVSWDGTIKTASGVKDGVEVKITIGENVLYKNGEAIELDAVAEIINSRTMVPVRAISEAFGANVGWDDENKVVKIVKDEIKKEKTKIIRIGTHAISEDDPYYIDKETNLGVMDDKEADARKIALRKVKEKLGVDIEFVQYPSDYNALIEKSIEDGKPFCELAVLWAGSQKKALQTNILQPIDDYTHVFYEPDGSDFPLQPEIDRHYYFMQRDFSYISSAWPIVYNAGLLDKVPGLKEPDGTTLYPGELYYRGEWTWSNFKDYLKIIDDYCKNNTGVLQLVPFETNYSFFAAEALHSVGAGIYDGEKILADTPEALKACTFVNELFDNGLVSCEASEKNATDTGWISGTDAFINGETFFTNCAPWRLDEASGASGGSLGVVGFPYPDGTNPIKENTPYRHMNFGGDSVGLVRGVDKETARLAIEAYRTYMVEYCKALTYSQYMTDVVKKYAKTDAEKYGIDVNHSEIGEYNASLWTEFGKTPVNEYAEAFGQFWKWSAIFGKCAFADEGFDGYKEQVMELKIK